MTVNDDRPIVTAPAADPAPLGLAAFALTTFLLSAANAGWMTSASGDAWLGYAFAYGGLGQLLAGMWEFRNRNVFGATAFSTYGGFWIGLGLWALLVAPAAGAKAGKDVAWILLAFAIFNTYMLFWSTMVNAAVFSVFLTLELTEVILFIGNPGADRGHLVHRELRGQCQHREVRRLCGHRDRAVRLVRLGRGRGQRHGRADDRPRGPGALEPGRPGTRARRARISPHGWQQASAWWPGNPPGHQAMATALNLEMLLYGPQQPF